MKKVLFLFSLFVLSISCNGQTNHGCAMHEAVSMTAGEYIYNIPCKVYVIHPELEGKALLMLWLHGGVHAPARFTLLDSTSATNYTTAPDRMKDYFERTNTKAIMLLPICKKADTQSLQTWPDCWVDVKTMIDGYVNKGIVDKTRIYVSGSSDGGTGTWQYVAQHPDVFAAGIALSSSLCQENTTLPVFWFTTVTEGDQTEKANQLKAQGSIVQYKYCGDVKHGGDDRQITDSLLDTLLTIKKTD